MSSEQEENQVTDLNDEVIPVEQELHRFLSLEQWETRIMDSNGKVTPVE